MASQWFYQTSEGQQSGPVDSRELRRLAGAGTVRPDTLVRKGASGRWLRAAKVRGLFQRSTPTPSSSPSATPPLPPPLPEFGAPRKGVSGESPIRHGPRAPAVKEASEKSKRIWLTWAAIIAGSGTVLLLLWALVFRGSSTPPQPAEKDQPLLAAAQSAEPGTSAPTPQAVPQPTKSALGAGDIHARMRAFEQKERARAEAAELRKEASGVATGNVKILELADLAELVGPSVVQVDVTGPDEAGTGSGFVLDKQGTIVTNFHVIEDATAGRTVFSDRTSAPITGYLGVWPEKDIALVRVECPPDKLHPLRLAKLAPRQGERVAAFGSPLGLQQSVSEGVVSAVRESEELRTLGPIAVNARLIQTTAPISPGNSGGPLVDMKGMVVGVNTMTFRPLDGQNVNFAVAAVELPSLFLAKNATPSPLPARDPAADGVRRILSRAWDHLNAREYDRAIADYTEAIRLDPKNARAYSGRGEAYRLKGDYDSAIADGTEAIRLDPENAGAYFGRGLAFRSKRDYDSAIADYTEAIRLDPENAFATFQYCERGQAYFEKGDDDSAIDDFTQAIRLDPKNTSAYFRRGLVYFLKGDNGRCITDCTEAIRLDPTDALAYHVRGLAYRDKRDYDSAIADFTEAIRLDPENGATYYWRGRAYQDKGQRAAAERDFAKAKGLGYKR